MIGKKKITYSFVMVSVALCANAQEHGNQNAVAREQAENQAEMITKDSERSTIAFLKSQDQLYALRAENEAYAREQMSKGNRYLKAIMENKQNEIPVDFAKPFIEIQKDYLNAIIAICWALFDKAVASGQAFTGGTIVIQDRGKVFDFLFDYAKRANESLANGKRNPLHISTNCFAYERHSSHFPEMQKNYAQYGIDVRYGQGALETLLPANKAHIVFGKLNDRFFIKMETYGLCARDASAVKHGLEFFKGTKGKKGPSRREDVPKAVKDMLQKMLDAISKQNKAAIVAEIGKPEIIKNIYSLAKKLSMIKNTAGSKEAGELVTYLEQNFDHLDMRRGNEVILVL